MKRWGVPAEQLWIAELPAAEESAGVRVEYNGWGDVLPEEFCAPFQSGAAMQPHAPSGRKRALGDLMREKCSPARADQRQAAQRAGGFYDFLIERAIDRQGGAAFLQAKVIGKCWDATAPAWATAFSHCGWKR